MKRQDHIPSRSIALGFCTVAFFFGLLFSPMLPTRAAVIEKWVKKYDGGSTDIIASLAIDRDGNVVVGGTSYIGLPPNRLADWEYYTAKYASSDGTQLWVQRYNGLANGIDKVTSVAVDSHGDVYVTGSSEGVSTTESYMARYAGSDGRLIWGKRSTYRGAFLMLDNEGNVVVAGQSFYSAKHAATNGDLLWESRYPETMSRDSYTTQALALSSNGDLAMTGSFKPWAGGSDDYMTVKISGTNGTLLWAKQYEGPAYSSDLARGVAVDRAGNVVVTGSSYGLTGRYDIYTAKYDSTNGDLIWENRYDGPEHRDDLSTAIALDDNGNAIVAGGSRDLSGGTDMLTVKYAASDGGLIWEKRYNGPGNSEDIAWSIVADPSGHVVVAGNSVGNGSTNDIYTAKYATSDEALLWEMRYNGPNNENDLTSSRCLALGPNGMVAVAGYSDSLIGAGANYDAATFVYVEAQSPLSILLTNGFVHINFSGAPATTYQIERATSVSGSWEAIAISTSSASGYVDYIDTNRPPRSAFYRTRIL